MSKLGLVHVVFVGSLVAACVSDTAKAPDGTLNGACFSNQTCNTGLVCNLTNLTCTTGDASTTDASTPADSSTGDSGLPVCTFAPTAWPSGCTGGLIGASCFGAAQACSATACGITDERWECFGPNQCNQAPCCITATNGAVTPGQSCAQGALAMTAGTTSGAACGSGAGCGSDDAGPKIQLCQFNSQCPKGQICSPVKVLSDQSSINNAVLGACMAP